MQNALKKLITITIIWNYYNQNANRSEITEYF